MGVKTTFISLLAFKTVFPTGKLVIGEVEYHLEEHITPEIQILIWFLMCFGHLGGTV